MNQLLKLLLLAPTAFSPLISMIMVAPAYANTTTWVNVSQNFSCQRTPIRDAKQLVCKRINGTIDSEKIVDLTQAKAEVIDDGILPDGTPTSTFDFTDEESNTSVALFGCDCPVCIRSLRQLRNMVS